MKILVVEDDRSLADVLRRGLCETGHVVDVERDGVSARALAAPKSTVVLNSSLSGP